MAALRDEYNNDDTDSTVSRLLMLMLMLYLFFVFYLGSKLSEILIRPKSIPALCYICSVC